MMNAANIERMRPLPIDFQLRSEGKYDHPRANAHEITVVFTSMDHMANGALM